MLILPTAYVGRHEKTALNVESYDFIYNKGLEAAPGPLSSVRQHIAAGPCQHVQQAIDAIASMVLLLHRAWWILCYQTLGSPCCLDDEPDTLHARSVITEKRRASLLGYKRLHPPRCVEFLGLCQSLSFHPPVTRYPSALALPHSGIRYPTFVYIPPSDQNQNEGHLPRRHGSHGHLGRRRPSRRHQRGRCLGLCPSSRR
jgi:hypothetical protein